MKMVVRSVYFYRVRDGLNSSVKLDQETANGSMHEVELYLPDGAGDWFRERIGKVIDLKAEDT